MRTLALVTLAAALAAVPAGAGGYPDGTYCPDYDLHVGDEETGVHATSFAQRPWGAVVVAFDGYYFVEDTFSANSIGEPYMFSLWLYQESNDRYGLQRGDPVCSQVEVGGPWADTIVNS